MNLSELFIKRPVATTLIMVAAVFFGIMGYRQLPVSDLPNVDFPTLEVSAGLPGASPETMASSVATPLEKQFATIAGVSSISSSNSQGSTRITLQFTLDRNIDAAAQDVQAMISRTLRSLPQGMPSPPSFRKVNPADSPILFLTASSKTLPLSVVDEYAENTVGQRISMVSGVAQVSVFGAQKYAVRILMDPVALAARKIGVDEVASAIGRWNVNTPAGILNGDKEAFVIQSNGQLNDADAYRPLVVAWRNGTPVRLDQVAQVLDSVENDKTATWYNGDARDLPGHPAPARHEHRGGRRQHPQAAAGLPVRSCRRRCTSRCSATARSPIRDSVQRRQAHAAPDARAWSCW